MRARRREHASSTNQSKNIAPAVVWRNVSGTFKLGFKMSVIVFVLTFQGGNEVK